MSAVKYAGITFLILSDPIPITVLTGRSGGRKGGEEAFFVGYFIMLSVARLHNTE